MHALLQFFFAIGVVTGLVSLVVSLRSGAIELVPMTALVKRAEYPLYYWIAIVVQITLILGCAGLAARF